MIGRLGWPAAAVVGAVVLFFCGLHEARNLPTQSDGASIALQAWGMLHGNLLLHGWRMADVTFYTTELPEYMVVELFRGLHPSVVQISSALTYTLLVLLAAFTARGAARGRTGIARVAIAVAIMLGPAIGAATTLLNDPDHTGTAVPVLIVFALIDRAPRRWYVPVLAGLVLAVALVGDPLVLLIGVAPVLLVFGVRAVVLLIQRRVPWADAWYEVSLVAAALVAIGASSVAMRLIRALGGFHVFPGSHKFVDPTQMPANVWSTLSNFLSLYSANFFGKHLDSGLIVMIIHIIAAAMVAVAVWLGVRRLLRREFGDLLVPLLAAAIAVDVLAYALLYQVTPGTAREIAPVFALGAALAGRVFAEPLLRNRLEPLLAAGVACAVLAMAPPLISSKSLPPDSLALSNWLEQHNLTQGIAGYWQANSVTLDTAGKVQMRALKKYPKFLYPFPWELYSPLLDARTYNVNFLVANEPGPQHWRVTQQDAVAKFGQPVQIYHFRQFVIMVYDHNLLPPLTAGWHPPK